MADSTAQTTMLLHWVDRMREGDRAAREELIRGFQGRLEILARKMLRRYRRVGRWVEAEDVLQAALIRLLRALESVRPESTRSFLGLAAEQMRRELLDLSRHFYGPQGDAAHHDSVAPSSEDSRLAIDPPDQRDDPDDLDDWHQFHQSVEHLPILEREVVGLIYYHGWNQEQVAEHFHIDVRTVRRRWASALTKLQKSLKQGS
jgi:RNA polymerase sigma-70 factor (ECF subfamily)